LRSLEERFAITITVSADESVRAPQAFIIERGEQVHTPEAARALAEQAPPLAIPLEDEDDLEETAAAEGAAEAEAEEATEDSGAEQREGGSRRRRRRRRGRGGREEAHAGGEEAPLHGEGGTHEPANEAEDEDDVSAEGDGELAAGGEADFEQPRDEAQLQDRQDTGESQGEHSGERRRRRRGRRGGRRNRHERERDGDNGHDFNGRGEQPHGEFGPVDLDQSANSEADLTSAVADLDTAPQGAAPLPYDTPFASPMPVESPVPAQSAEVVASNETAETSSPPRRRSTVREAAPVSGGDAPAETAAPSAAPAAEPVITEIDEGEAASRPRRTGWWARRFAGG